jgi:hypothetical protein
MATWQLCTEICVGGVELTCNFACCQRSFKNKYKYQNTTPKTNVLLRAKKVGHQRHCLDF